jgi:dTDP-glucose 4,6-dehydratase
VLEHRPDWSVCNLDKLSYAGNPENLAEFEGHPRYSFCHGDACDPECVRQLLAAGVDVVVNFAAETHVDRSIAGPAEVWRNNVLLAETLLSAAREHGTGKFVQISTDEVYGSLGPTGRFTEASPLHPNNPYSASKAAADLLALAFHHTYGLPVVIVRCSNNYGPYQFPEKVIPLFITNAMEDKPLPLYGDGLHVRDWIYVEDFCRAVGTAIEKGKEGEVYNVGGEGEIANLDITRLILDTLHKPHSLITHIKDRPGHDRRYAMDFAKARKEFGWRPQLSLREGMERTVQWYLTHTAWWQRIKSGEYREYYRKHYVERHGLKPDAEAGGKTA